MQDELKKGGVTGGRNPNRSRRAARNGKRGAKGAGGGEQGAETPACPEGHVLREDQARRAKDLKPKLQTIGSATKVEMGASSPHSGKGDTKGLVGLPLFRRKIMLINLQSRNGARTDRGECRGLHRGLPLDCLQ